MKRRGYTVLVVLQVALVLIVLLVSRSSVLRFPALHGSPFKLLVTFSFVVLSVLFFIPPFRPASRSYTWMGLIMNLVVLMYLWYAWFSDVSLSS